MQVTSIDEYVNIMSNLKLSKPKLTREPRMVIPKKFNIQSKIDEDGFEIKPGTENPFPFL